MDTTKTEDGSSAACPLCGGPNACVMARNGGSGGATCWCESISFTPELLARIPENRRGVACVCAACAEAARTRRE